MKSILVLLISKVFADCAPCGLPANCKSRRCEPESSHVECCESDFSNCFGKECQEYIKCFPGVRDDRKSHESIVQPKPFVSWIKCPTPGQCCVPYLEFNRIVEFFVTIPNGKKLAVFIEKKDLKSLERLASRGECNENYDALSAFYYFADSLFGICPGQFSYDFILYFLTRFYYYLQLVFIDNCACISGTELIHIKTKKWVDLLDIPSAFNNVTFGNEGNALRIFNIIISDTTITKRVTDFIIVLRRQIIHAFQKCNPGTVVNGPPSCVNTYFLYVDLLVEYLKKTLEITAFNLHQKIEFITPLVQFPWVLQPYLTTASPPTKAFVNFPLNLSSFSIDNTARFIQ